MMRWLFERDYVMMPLRRRGLARFSLTRRREPYAPRRQRAYAGYLVNTDFMKRVVPSSDAGCDLNDDGW